jgi:glycosidase
VKAFLIEVGMEKRIWWKQAVGYEIYPQTFADSNNDGIGDLPGITSKLNYLKRLGIDLIWICPFLKSPMDDNGYDIADYYCVNPLFGTNDDLKELIKQAHALGIHIIMDFVLNHTSDENAWFIEARKNKQAEEHDYYIWQPPRYDEKGNRQPPNNWRGFFSDSAWAYDEVADEYYMRIFSKKMPDLNWENPLLRKKIYAIARHYLDLGIDGFRLDAIAHLARDLSFANSTQNPDYDGLTLDVSKFSNRERLFDYLHEFKKAVLEDYPLAMTVGEVGGSSTTLTALKYSHKDYGSINMVFNFDTCWENGAYGSETLRDDQIITNVWNLKHNFARWYNDCHRDAWLPLYWVNHDHPRVLSQYGNVAFRKESGKMLALVLLFMYGTPFLYQGEELGMSNVDYQSLDDFKSDVSARNYILDARKRGLNDELILRFLRRTSRINSRTPMQWKNAPYAGFSLVPPRIKPVNNYQEVNAEDEIKDPDSIFNFYRQAIALRKDMAILDSVTMSDFVLENEDDPNVFAYRHPGKKHLFVVANFRPYQVNFSSDFLGRKHHTLLQNYLEPSAIRDGNQVSLRPFECFLWEIEDN